MKQHILALGAAAALGLASVSHAIVVFGPESDPKASHVDWSTGASTLPTYFDVATNAQVEAQVGTKFEQASGGIGNMLFAPYYNVQGDTTTLISIVNTDTKNGKAVKVRFRSAGNSDDVLDFTLLLSPGDVWSAGLGKLSDNWPVITTADNSCILPVGGRELMQGDGVKMIDGRLPQTVSEAVRKQLMGEGYIEVLNMADIPPQYSNPYAPDRKLTLFEEIKHVDGMAPCAGGPNLVSLLNTTVVDPDAAIEYGLAAPTGGLMGSWIIQNQTLRNSYSGNMTAVRVLGGNGVPGWGNIIFAPQVGEEIGTAFTGLKSPYKDGPQGGIEGLTGDPLLVTSNPFVTPLWYDLPDMSTPVIDGLKGPLDQVMALDLARWQIWNQYLSDKNGEVPMWSDWVVSQPTRRYYAAVSYADATETKKAGKDIVVFNSNMGTASDLSDGHDGEIWFDNELKSREAAVVTGKQPTTAEENPYNILKLANTDFGPFACLPSDYVQTSAADTEESFGTVVLQTGAFSPGTPDPGSLYCGEVFVLGFADTSVFDATVTSEKWKKVVGSAGMAQINFKDRALPVVGFSATAYGNQTANMSYGAVMPHRWN